MSNTNQSLIKVYSNDEGEIVLVYGSSDSDEFQQLELDSIVIENKDAIAISKALIKCAKGIRGE